MSDRRVTSCVFFFGSIVLYGVYFYYEMFVQSDIRFTRDTEEANDMYDGISSAGEKGVRYCDAWWALQVHQFYGLGAAFLGILYLVAVEFQQGTAFGIGCSCYFGFVAIFLFAAIVWWFIDCNSRTENGDCFALRDRAHSTIVDKNLQVQVPLFYIIMMVLSAASAIAIFCLLREVDRREGRRYREKTRQEAKRGSSQGSTRTRGAAPYTDDTGAEPDFSIFASKSSFAQRLTEKTDKNIKNL